MLPGPVKQDFYASFPKHSRKSYLALPKKGQDFRFKQRDHIQKLFNKSTHFIPLQFMEIGMPEHMTKSKVLFKMIVKRFAYDRRTFISRGRKCIQEH